MRVSLILTNEEIVKSIVRLRHGYTVSEEEKRGENYAYRKNDFNLRFCLRHRRNR